MAAAEGAGLAVVDQMELIAGFFIGIGTKLGPIAEAETGPLLTALPFPTIGSEPFPSGKYPGLMLSVSGSRRVY